ncbi:unnamed protein product [Allacma fusca]|uniref:Uncharacterized protein n=1 Tax=Allacma fusca TaxID=39272 RepID=A0A8J2NZN3_9HEXA|nr:unnamed protein product [Allacma fusca]
MILIEDGKGSDNFSVGVGLSIASPTHHTSRYMADQTFHTPNFGDEEFDIPPIALPQSGDGSHGQGNMSYSLFFVILYGDREKRRCVLWIRTSNDDKAS